MPTMRDFIERPSCEAIPLNTGIEKKRGRCAAPLPIASAITPATMPAITMPPVATSVPPASARIEGADHDGPRDSYDRPWNGYDWSTVGMTAAVRSAVPTNATSLGGFRRRRHAQHGSNGNDAENRLSHVNLFSRYCGAAAC